MTLRKINGRRVLFCVVPILLFLLIHIVFDRIAYQYNPFEIGYYQRYLSGYFEIYLVVALILSVGILLRAKYFSTIFFIFAIYAEVQMLFGYWRLGPHPTMGPAVLQFLIYAAGFILGIAAEPLMRAIGAKKERV